MRTELTFQNIFVDYKTGENKSEVKKLLNKSSLEFPRPIFFFFSSTTTNRNVPAHNQILQRSYQVIDCLEQTRS